MRFWFSLLSIILLLCLTPLFSSTLLSNLSPVYGSIPTYHNAYLVHVEWLVAPYIVFLESDFKLLHSLALLQIAATPLALRYFYFPLSSTVGPKYGPLLTQLISYSPTHVFCCSYLVQFSSELHILVSDRWASLTNGLSSSGNLAKAVALVTVYGLSQMGIKKALEYKMAYPLDLGAFIKPNILHRSETLHLVVIFYILILSRTISRRLLSLAMVVWTISILLYGDLPMRSHMAAVNRRLDSYGFTVLDARDSQTGYISVVENFQDGFRVLRSDHSLLGGTWMPNPDRGLHKSETVYPIFNMLEAVRLMEYNLPDSKSRKSALVIGLGVGTAPSALAAHGIETTAVEIDTSVIHFAQKYFDLHQDVINVNTDAVAYVTRAQEDGIKYDYIIHDVFTGGAEPAELFTVEFLKAIQGILKSSGSIAINYAGDLGQPSTVVTLMAIFSTFRKCRMFRDSDPRDARDKDVVNIVTFCRNEEGDWRFREPVEADFLESESRRQYLLPRHEIDAAALSKQSRDRDTLDDGNVSDSETYRLDSALEHWLIMREVLPPVVWENY